MSSLTTILAYAISGLINGIIPAFLATVGYSLLSGDYLSIQQAAGVWLLFSLGFLLFTTIVNFWNSSRATSNIMSQLMSAGKFPIKGDDRR